MSDSTVERHRPTTFSAIELADFATGFERVRGQLPRMFQPFWHRWTYHAEIPAIRIWADSGRIALCLFRGNLADAQMSGLENHLLLHPWPPRVPLHQVLQAAGLLQAPAFGREVVLW